MLGFRNLGNTCYMNSVLSVLMNSSNFVSILTRNSIHNNQEGRRGDAVRLLHSFL